MNKILIINAGSSSIKLSLFAKEDLKNIASGLAERITLADGLITIKFNNQTYKKSVSMPNHTVAVQHILELMSEIKLIKNPKEIEIIGFRVVHGGIHFTKHTKLTPRVINLIESCNIYAPLHNPGALQAINAFQKVMPHAKMSAEFDTSFHTTIPEINAIYPIPSSWTKELGIKRYGAHGISHEYITTQVQKLTKKLNVNFINLHIGNGASICAVKDSKSFDTSMGLTPLAGIMMGTRSGDIDPSIPNFVAQSKKMSIQEVTDNLNFKSGLLGVSEISSDMRDIEKAMSENNKKAIFAFELYCQRIADYIATYANKIENRLDALVFTAGVGENAPLLRQKVIDKLHFLNIKLDQKLNNEKIGQWQLISTVQSDVKVYVIRTNEELLIAQHALEMFEK